MPKSHPAWVIASMGLWSFSAAMAESPASQPASSYVRHLDLPGLRARLRALPPAEGELVALYAEAARRDVLTPADGNYPLGAPVERYRNLAERAKGAAVLAVLAPGWPDELRARCRTEAKAWVREVALAHRVKPSLEYPWQAAFWVAEAGIAGWFLWDELDADLQNAVAEMVVYQADRFINVKPKTGFHGDTEAETISWNSTILTLAPNMMPDHPHRRAWDEAACRYLYNTLTVAQDATSTAPADGGRRVRDWVLGANLYPDFALENHGQFHIDYVFAAYRFHIQGAALYWLAGTPLPLAFHHHARDVYEKILLPSMTADGFFAYVSDNDWKRYHNWIESCTVHAYLGLLEQDPLAVSLERRALVNAMRHWRAFPPGFAYDTPYVCGKAWTTRAADAVLMHVARPKAPPAPLPGAEVDAKLRGTSRLDTADLLTHFAADGSYRSSCRGKEGAWVRFVAPREDPVMLLPVAANYQACVGGKPVIANAASQWQRGPDWFWTVRRHKGGRSMEAFISLPGAVAIHVQHLATADMPQGGVVESTIAVEKPYAPVTACFDGGAARWQPGTKDWQRENRAPGDAIDGNWLNLQDRIGFVAMSIRSGTGLQLRLPAAGVRDRIRLQVKPDETGLDACIVVLPGCDHGATERIARSVRMSRAGEVVTCVVEDTVVAVNTGTVAATFQPSISPASNETLQPGAVGAWSGGRRLF